MERSFRLYKRLILLIGGATVVLGLSAPETAADPLGELLNSSEVMRLRSRSAVNERNAPPGIDETGEYWSLFRDPEEGPKQIFDWLGDPGRSYKLANRRILNTDDFVGVHATFEDTDARVFTMRVLVPHPKRFLAADAGLITAFREISETAFDPDAVDKVQFGKLSGTVLTRVSGQCLLKISLERHAWFTVSLAERCDDPSPLSQFAKRFFLDRLNLKLQR